MSNVKSLKAIGNELDRMHLDVIAILAENADNQSAKLVDLARCMKEIQDVQDSMDAVWKELTRKYDELRLRLIPDAMAEEDVRTLTIDGIGRVGLTSDAYVSIIDNGDGVGKKAAYDWLEESGYGGLIMPYVQPATLKAAIKEGLKQGEWFPEELFKVQPFMRASITKVRAKA